MKINEYLVDRFLPLEINGKIISYFRIRKAEDTEDSSGILVYVYEDEKPIKIGYYRAREGTVVFNLIDINKIKYKLDEFFYLNIAPIIIKVYRRFK